MPVVCDSDDDDDDNDVICDSDDGGLWRWWRWFVMVMTMVCEGDDDGLWWWWRWFVMVMTMVCDGDDDGLWWWWRWFVMVMTMVCVGDDDDDDGQLCWWWWFVMVMTMMVSCDDDGGLWWWWQSVVMTVIFIRRNLAPVLMMIKMIMRSDVSLCLYISRPIHHRQHSCQVWIFTLTARISLWCQKLSLLYALLNLMSKSHWMRTFWLQSHSMFHFYKNNLISHSSICVML